MQPENHRIKPGARHSGIENKLTNIFIYYSMRSEVDAFMPVFATVVGTKIFKMASRNCFWLLFLLYKFISVQ